jgi:hypothetical protein
MKMLVSKNRSTQLTKQLSSPRENRVEGVPVMHLWRKKKKCNGYMGNGQIELGERDDNALVPAQTGKGVDRLLDTRLRLLPLKESLELFLQRHEQECQY